jgi:hypothetical protein
MLRFRPVFSSLLLYPGLCGTRFGCHERLGFVAIPRSLRDCDMPMDIFDGIEGRTSLMTIVKAFFRCFSWFSVHQNDRGIRSRVPQ